MTRLAGGRGGDDPRGEILGRLGDDLGRTLAGFAGMSSLAIEASIALLPLGDRLRLATYGIIDEGPDEELAEAGFPSEFGLTQDGHDVIAFCASKFPDELDERGRETGPPDPHLVEQLDRVFTEIFGARESAR
jgi:hypothetical protein